MEVRFEDMSIRQLQTALSTHRNAFIAINTRLANDQVDLMNQKFELQKKEAALRQQYVAADPKLSIAALERRIDDDPSLMHHRGVILAIQTEIALLQCDLQNEQQTLHILELFFQYAIA